MKGYHGSHSQYPCHCVPEDCDQTQKYLHHSQDPHQSFLPDITEPYSLDHRYYTPRGTAMPSECQSATISIPEPLNANSSTFPRMHHSQQFDSCEECMAVAQTSSKINRLPANLLDQFEKQIPLHHDGFHTLQYQRTGTSEQRSESPSRIRHLVHSVQKLFAKSHSLEAPSKREYNGTKIDLRSGDSYHHHHHSRHSKRSKSKERKSESRQRAKITGWWSSDDNLDSDSGYLVSGRHILDPTSQYCVDMPESAFRDLTLKSLKSSSEGKCLACAGMSMSLDGQALKRSAWSTMTVSQARESYPGSAMSQEKPMLLQEGKTKERTYHYLQVPQDDWSGYPGIKDGEIPCRRMRSGSYIKAMGDDDSGDSDTSPKMSPKGIPQNENYHRTSSVDQIRSKYSCKHCSDSYICNRPSSSTPSKLHSRSFSYGRSFNASQLRDQLTRRHFETACESVFGEVESQAVDALDLPGCFRMRSHSYLRAIQAGCSQDDDCLSVFSMSAPALPSSSSGIMKSSVSFNYRKAPPPIPPRIATKPIISITAQSSTESNQDNYLPREVTPAPPWPKEVKTLCNSTDSLDSAKVLSMSGESSTTQFRTPMKPATVINHKGIMCRTEPKIEKRIRKWCPSIGVQVDSSETVSDSDTESKSQREFHSIGVQVEDKRRARFRRSNSVTASVQADLELEGFHSLSVATEDKALQFGRPFQRHSSEPGTSSQYTVYRTVHTQGDWAYQDYPLHYDAVEIPQQDSWTEPISRSLPNSGRASPCIRDGEWFIKMLQSEVERMEGWCQQMERDAEEYDLPEEILEKIRSAVGSAQLLMSQKVQQFYGLCQQNMDPNAFPLPTSQDLAGFWDLLQLSIEDVSVKFAELQQLKANGWKLENKEEKKVPPPIPKKPSRLRTHPTKERSMEQAERQRLEARKRLLSAKRAASFRQSSATESADSIEIYIPEAQTRL
ncbi:disks large-associated protein 3 [Protopterus annectens]|uniref:disks large-associated protein 3 n=1 Tax=Protopterus annectens TaxID=7888 RepID=UPI001CFAEB0E|nr:disks large-associated protein 3 [Protopterus annectens]